MTDLYAIPNLPGSLRPNRVESEISFVAPIARRNHVINPSFEVDDIGETQPYNWSVGEYAYMTNQLVSTDSVGAVVSENSYNGFKAMRINLSDTTNSLVYGITQPISVPLSMQKNAFISGGDVYYNIRGVLSFYVFAPAIKPSLANVFTGFNQPAGTEHIIDVDIYATVDANNLPTGQFNEQNIVQSSKVTITVPESAFFSEDVEPNVIGARKNPVWERHYVYFSVAYKFETQTFLRFSISNNDATFTGANFLFYLDAVQLEFFDDIYQYPTTYLDGDLGKNDPLDVSGYYWEGAPLKSTSFRSQGAFSGGVLFNLQNDFAFQTLSITGLGMPEQENEITPFMIADGQQYNGTGISDRKIKISGYISNGTFLEAVRKAGRLQDLLSGERIGEPTMHRFYFRIPPSCNEGSEYIYFNAIVEQIVVEPLSELPEIIVSIELSNPDIYFYGDNYAYQFPTALNPVEKLKRFDIVMFHAQGGSPIDEYYPRVREFDVYYKESFYGYASYDLHVNGLVHTWCELDNGLIIFGGQFTQVTYTINNIPNTVSCNHIAILQSDGKVIPIRDFYKRHLPAVYNKNNGVFGTGAVVRAIVQTADGGIMIGGKFDRFVGRNYDCRNIVYIDGLNAYGEVFSESRDVAGGLVATGPEQGVFALEYDRVRGYIYVGGSFTSAVRTINTEGTQLRNAAIYKINSAYKWSQMQFGANGTVRTIAARAKSGEILLGGSFTAMYASTGTLLRLQTRYAAIYNIHPNTPNDRRVYPLCSVSAFTTNTTLPARNSVFDKAVNKMKVVNNEVIIGGEFTQIDYNENTLPSAILQTESANRIVKWQGFNRFAQMGSGIANNGIIGYSTTVLDICSSPYNEDVYVVGQFSKAGNINSAYCIARWSKGNWEALNFEIQVEQAKSVFVSKRGYGFVSVSTFAPVSKKDTLYTAYPIAIENVGIQNQFVLEITNPKTNRFDADLVSIYNTTTNKSATFNLKIAVGETIKFDFTRPNVRPESNIRNLVVNSLVGGGTFANMFFTEGRNVLQIIAGQRQNAALNRPIQVYVRYYARQISPYQIFSGESVRANNNLTVGWNLGKSRLGLDTKVFTDLKVDFPAYDWSSYQTWTLDRDELGDDTIINE